ncbi:hypothetical protein SAMN05661010_01941 [Modicisalibacter muralis]|uniref:Uncharacterized protein n=1 Tax=Modicisalibacter muralis TaxID=119000 RepID=A0A1G9KXX2_9GAMM|nr:hypothetical protein [Halomonas muralis]SDL54317.1 hypothetical protein SAMN05661010_01941 [Halomonas muralis]
MAIIRAPAGEEAFYELYSPALKWTVRRARLQHAIRESFQRYVGVPIEELWFQLWWTGGAGAQTLERLGLPRRSIESCLGDALTLMVDPRRLLYSARLPRGAGGSAFSSSTFIWDGDWDLRRGDLRAGSRYRFISELDERRDDLRATERFRTLKARLDEGRPWSSHQQGILLDSEQKILAYLRLYLGFLDGMAQMGFNAQLGKDRPGVAISRTGKILKINRGLHRLAMAQRLGIPQIPVQVRAVHRQWWNDVTGDAVGHAALAKLLAALPDCEPELEAGPLVHVLPGTLTNQPWPEPRVSQHLLTRDCPTGVPVGRSPRVDAH